MSSSSRLDPGASVKDTTHRAYTRRIQANSNAYLVPAYVDQEYLVDIVKEIDFCARFLRRPSFISCFLNSRWDLVIAFILV